MSFVISRPLAEWTVRLGVPLALGFAALGLWEIVTLPQPSSPEFYTQVAEAAVQGTTAPRKDKTAAVTGMIKIMLGVGTLTPLVLVQRSLAATKVKLSPVDKPYELVARRHSYDEWGKGEDKSETPRHKTEGYQAVVRSVVAGAAKVTDENQWVQNLLGCPVVICVGLGGTGKSRSASALSILKTLFWNTRSKGADTIILDPQLEANQHENTWVSGELHNLDSIADTQEEVLRTQAGARYLTTIFDEVKSWARDYGLKDYMAAAIAHAGEVARKTNQAHIFVCQDLADFTWDKDEVAKLFKTAEIIYFIPEPQDALGFTPRSKVVAIKKRNADYSPYKAGSKDWMLHNVPDDLDPAKFEQRIGQDLAELRMGAVEIAKTPANNGISSNGKVAALEQVEALSDFFN